MKHLMTLLALVVAVTAGAQGTTIHEYPWNPDWNNDNYIGSQDLTGFLSAFGSEFGNPPEPCDYDGTPLENFINGVSDGSIVLDSMFIEYEILDIHETYLFGCPDPVSDTIIIANSAMMSYMPYGGNGGPWKIVGPDAFNHPGFNTSMEFAIHMNIQNGTYNIEIESNYLQASGYQWDGFFGGSVESDLNYTLPMDPDWSLDENGIHLSGWNPNDWAYYATYLHILPYWHYAE